MHKKLFLVIYILIFVTLLFAPKTSLAMYSQGYQNVFINEIMPDPEGSDSDYEWVEIYNKSELEVNISSCYIDYLPFPNNTIIKPREYLVVAKDLLDKDNDNQSFETYWGDSSGVWGDSDNENYDAVQINISLKNSDDYLEFKCGDYVNIVSWKNSISGQSISLTESGEWVYDSLVTPGRENIKSSSQMGRDILISEVYPSPQSGENEWIELYNFSDDSINIGSWVLEDSTKRYTISKSIIEPGEYFVLEGSLLKISLNNSGEKLTLYNPNGEIIDTFEYTETPKGK